MIAPRRVSPELYDQLVATWLEENAICIGVYHAPTCQSVSEVVTVTCNCGGRQAHVCKQCNLDIQYRMSIMSIHFGGWSDSCVGAGEMVYPTLPYCPNCNHGDSIYGCVHIEGVKITDEDIAQMPMPNQWTAFASAYSKAALVIAALAVFCWAIYVFC